MIRGGEMSGYGGIARAGHRELTKMVWSGRTRSSSIGRVCAGIAEIGNLIDATLSPNVTGLVAGGPYLRSNGTSLRR